MRVLVIEKNASRADAVVSLFREQNQATENITNVATNLDDGLHRVKAWKPHMVILGLDIEDAAGFESDLQIVAKMRLLAEGEYTPLLVCAHNAKREHIEKIWSFGVDAIYLGPPDALSFFVVIRALTRQKEVHDALKRAHHRIDELSAIDELTGLLNMKTFFRRGDEVLIRSRKSQIGVSMVLMNLDGFGAVNQDIGFTGANGLLQDIAGHMKRMLRQQDMLARVGADEFCVLFPDTNAEDAEKFADQLRHFVQSSVFKSQKQSVRLTACCGVASLSAEQGSQAKLPDLFHLAAEALRTAKANGVNRTETLSFSLNQVDRPKYVDS